jgi:copper homeostasis protein
MVCSLLGCPIVLLMLIRIQVMIRPRTGDFVYDETEIQVMIEDLRLFKATGANGFVFGLLNIDGSIDEAKTARFARMLIFRVIGFNRKF